MHNKAVPFERIAEILKKADLEHYMDESPAGTTRTGSDGVEVVRNLGLFGYEWEIVDTFTKHNNDGPSSFKLSDDRNLLIQWYVNGKRHREDGPALICLEEETGKILCQGWSVNGVYHREDGPAVKIPGEDIWYCQGKYHREDGPAIVLENGVRQWFYHGRKHRIDGPAAIGKNHTKMYYVDDVLLTLEQFNEWREWLESDPDNINLPWSWGLSLLDIQN